MVGRPLKALRAAWSATRKAAKLDLELASYTFTHMLATWIDAQDVPEGQIAKWFEHGKEGDHGALVCQAAPIQARLPIVGCSCD